MRADSNCSMISVRKNSNLHTEYFLIMIILIRPVFLFAYFKSCITGSISLAAFAFLLCVIMLSAHAEEAMPEAPPASLEEGRTTEIVWEFDPYYTNVGLHVPLTSAAIPTITSDSEVEIYRTLVEGSAIPRYMLLEASVYPMPLLGTYLKGHTRDFYNSWEIGNSGINFLESATAGFQEPWAVSAFFGNIAKLVRPGETRTGSNMGYTGYLVSAGSKHIKENMLISDNWYELEWKIKGKRDFPQDKLQWSFRAGGKFHDNPDITNVIYAGIRRSNLNANFPFFSWINNAEVDMKVHFAQHDGKMLRFETIFGKKYPLANKNYTPTLSVGFVWSNPKEYSGALLDRNKDTVTLVLRPSIEF